MMRIFTSGTTRGLPPCMVLDELGIQYAVINCDIGAADKPKELLRVNDAGRVPVLVDQGIILSQSIAILIYIAEKYKRFLPQEEPARSKVMCQLLHIATDVMSNHVTIFRLLRAPDQFNSVLLQRARDSLGSELARLNSALADTGFLSEELSIADFHLYTIVGQYDHKSLEERGFEAMVEWIERMRQLNGVRIVEEKIPYAYDVSNTLA